MIDPERSGLYKTLIPLGGMIATASSLIADHIHRSTEETATGLSDEMLQAADKKIVGMIDRLSDRENKILLASIFLRKKWIADSVQRINKLKPEDDLKGNLKRDEESFIEDCQYRLYLAFPHLQRLRQAIGLNLKPNDLSDDYLFPGNWAILVRGKGKLAGPPWERISIEPLNRRNEENNPEQDEIEISLAHLKISMDRRRLGDASSVRIFSVPLVLLSFDKPQVDVSLLDRKTSGCIYNFWNEEIYHAITPIKPPIVNIRVGGYLIR